MRQRVLGQESFGWETVAECLRQAGERAGVCTTEEHSEQREQLSWELAGKEASVTGET